MDTRKLAAQQRSRWVFKLEELEVTSKPVRRQLKKVVKTNQRPGSGHGWWYREHAGGKLGHRRVVQSFMRSLLQGKRA